MPPDRFDDVLEAQTARLDDADGQDDAWQALIAAGLNARVPFARHVELFHRVFARRPTDAPPPRTWRPDPPQAKGTNLGRFMQERGLATYASLHRWSATERAAFWEETVRRLGIVFQRPPTTVLDAAGDPARPGWFADARMNIAESCLREADQDRPAIIARGEGERTLRTVTYGELRHMVDRVVRGLRAAGFREGDAIALYLPMTIECVVAYLGIVQGGYVAVSIADSFAPKEVRTRLDIAGAKGIITVASFTRAGKRFFLYDKVREAQGPRAIVIADGEDVKLRDGDLRFDALLGDEGDAAAAIGTPDRTTNILFSSGTTGTPKAIPWTHLTPIKCAMDGHFHQDIRPGDVVAWPTNIGWMMGPWLIYAALINRATIALHTGAPNTPDFCSFVAETRVTMLGVVPALVRAWRGQNATDGLDWSAIRCFSSTGEASNQEDYLWLMAQADYRAPVIEYCGGTEIGGGHITGTVVQPASPATFTTPALGLDLVILDDHGAPVGEGEMGTLFLIPPSVGLSERLLNRDHDEEYHHGTPRGPQGETLRRHGDAVMRLPGGFYRAEGRADDTMNLGGIKVSSIELERVVDRDESVAQSAAVGVPPPGGGAEALVLFIVPREKVTDTAPLKKRLQERVSQELNPLFRIRDIVLVDALPRTASNKVMRRELRSDYRKRMVV